MKVLKAAVIALTVLTIIYARRASKVPALEFDLDDANFQLNHLRHENARLAMDRLTAEWQSDVMTREVLKLTTPTAPSTASDFAARLRAERDDEANTYGVTL